MSDSTRTGTNESITAASEQLDDFGEDISKLKEMLNGDSSLLGGDDIAELWKQLNGADSMALEVESKLDNVLSNLDNLLEALDSDSEEINAHETTKASSENNKDEETSN
ncbi:hypothetical protein CPB83DRAFT_904205 [Crepidotus variabilis]|uniref:Uncharacterized protein n=1 Tax=Crepidotus variabilis TaxID=179855 RepID=A0A9P6END0_9AGAR|nr:hypothetical protein CPB83DRAFT_904205 [Crepidotus variabilis]